MTVVEITEWVKAMETGAVKQQPSSRITNLSCGCQASFSKLRFCTQQVTKAFSGQHSSGDHRNSLSYSKKKWCTFDLKKEHFKKKNP